MALMVIADVLSLLIAAVSFAAIGLIFYAILNCRERWNRTVYQLVLLVECADAVYLVGIVLKAFVGLGGFESSAAFCKFSAFFVNIAPIVVMLSSAILAFCRMTTNTKRGLPDDHWLFDVLVSLFILAVVPISACYLSILVPAEAAAQYDRQTGLFTLTPSNDANLGLERWMFYNRAILGVVCSACSVGFYSRLALHLAKTKTSGWTTFKTANRKMLCEGLVPSLLFLAQRVVEFYSSCRPYMITCLNLLFALQPLIPSFCLCPHI